MAQAPDADDADPGDHPEFRAGSVSLFGVSNASDPDGKHAGSGLNLTLEITDIVDKLHLSGNFNADDLSVHIVPLEEVSEAANIRIGRLSLHRQFK